MTDKISLFEKKSQELIALAFDIAHKEKIEENKPGIIKRSHKIVALEAMVMTLTVITKALAVLFKNE